MTTLLIAIDADGVLVDYHQAYKKAWLQAFEEELIEVNPRAYWAKDRFAAKQLSMAERDKLRDAMGYDFWAQMQALPGAVQACQDLKAAGHRLVCVTALSAQYQQARAHNLRQLGFDFDDVVATGNEHAHDGASPKAETIRRLQADYFIDDYAPYFRGLEDHPVHKALATRNEQMSPNTGDVLNIVDSSHADLYAFSQWLSKVAR